ncbi:HD domain-containing protein [Candidatus Parcubacteria bacterium]|nr:HD domain-containing protein [Candidatus Parcubacteria bacterium]
MDHTAKLVLALCSVNHEQVKEHLERVALLSEEVAIMLGKDAKAAFFGGLLHDIAKIVLPYDLFYDNKSINEKEYEEIKTHALAGFEILRDFHEFTALCCGLHHSLYEHGYGLSPKDFPDEWDLVIIKKILAISTIISICDFIDAFTHRENSMNSQYNKKENSLEDMLKEKYPDDHQVIDIALLANAELTL